MIFKGDNKNPQVPKGRAEAGVTLIGNILHIYGGCNYESRFGDFWRYDLSAKTWGLITTEKSPGVNIFYNSRLDHQHPYFSIHKVFCCLEAFMISLMRKMIYGYSEETNGFYWKRIPVGVKYQMKL